MQAQAVLKALVKKIERTDDFDYQDNSARVLVSASLEVLKQLAAEMKCPQFDMDSDRDKAFLLKAVHEVIPEELTEEDKAIVQLLVAQLSIVQQVSESI